MVRIAEKTVKSEGRQAADKFKRFQSPSGDPLWLQPLRSAAREEFADAGFPTLNDEDWRFTNVAPISKLPLKQVPETASNPVEAGGLLKAGAFAGLTGPRLVFVNGIYEPGLSNADGLPAGVIFRTLGSALTAGHPVLEQHLGRHGASGGKPFGALNLAYFRDGGFLYVPAGVKLPGPVQLVYLTVNAPTGATLQPRNLIVVEAGSEATVLESYLGTGGSYFTNAATELVAGDNSILELVKLQDESPEAFHLASIGGQFGRSSRAHVHSFALGARISRNSIGTRLAGEGLECILNGLYVTKGEQVADHHMVVDHAQPHCASHEYFNGILDDKSKGVFHGRIHVHPVAQKTDAKQTNKNLLLSDSATIDTKPQLEIYADDVKCTHGATVGQLNEESIFYLRSRGIGTDTARRMLIHAFAGEIIERVQCPAAREAVDKLVWDRIEANPHVREG